MLSRFELRVPRDLAHVSLTNMRYWAPSLDVLEFEVTRSPAF
jgi:hypothetical protein